MPKPGPVFLENKVRGEAAMNPRGGIGCRSSAFGGKAGRTYATAKTVQSLKGRRPFFQALGQAEHDRLGWW
jgi:hypothetical protein